MEVKMHCTQAELIRNLEDAGCSEEMTRDFLKDVEEGKLPEGMKLLSKQREKLLDIVHREEKKIDCLDYLVYMLQKKNAV